MKRFVFFLLFASLSVAAQAQMTKVYQWRPAAGDTLARASVYHPEPILFVHGINANDAGWNATAIPLLQSHFASYDLPFSATSLADPTSSFNLAHYNAPQRPFLHTFNYGDKPNVHTHQSQSFQPIMWNAWHEDMESTPLVDVFSISASIPPTFNTIDPPQDDRETLDTRIDNVRLAYRPDPASTNQPPQIVLVAHSLGAMLAHYYLLKNPNDHGIRRFVAIAGAHQGSLLANALLLYTQVDPSLPILDGSQGLLFAEQLRNGLLPIYPDTAGFFAYTSSGAVYNAVSTTTNTNPLLQFDNPIMSYFWDNPAPKIEYVFNVFHRTPSSPYGVLYYAFDEPPSLDPVFIEGDGFLQPQSAAGKDCHECPSIYNGRSNTNGVHEIDPVIFGIWNGLDHSEAVTNADSLLKSIVGVPYRWPGASSNQWPAYARFYSENQSFSKYYSTPSSNSVAYTDEPGIADMKLLYDRNGGNPLLIPALSTWTVTNGVWQKTTTNRSDFAGHQLVIGTDGTVSFMGTVGVKNHSLGAVGWNGSNYWVVAGNEYLPASLGLGFGWDYAPVATNITAAAAGSFALSTGMISQCLVELGTNNLPLLQRGMFTNSFAAATTNQYFLAVQAKNPAGLLTPQAERAFDAPVDSATLVAILKKINEAEALSTRVKS
jgi:pimeloyl-ACP methyl ester carboxylesterase